MTQAPQGYPCKAGKVSVIIPSDRWENWEEVWWRDLPRAFLLTCTVNAWITQPCASASWLELPRVLIAANHWQKHKYISTGSSEGPVSPCTPSLVKCMGGRWQEGYANKAGTEHLPSSMPWKTSDSFLFPSPLIMIKALNHAFWLAVLALCGSVWVEERKHFDDLNQNFPLNTRFRPHHGRSKHSTLLPESSHPKCASSPKGHQKQRKKYNPALKLLARLNEIFLSRPKSKKVSGRQWGVNGRSMHFSLVPKPLRSRGAFQWGPDQVLKEHISSTARPAVWIQDLNRVIRAYSNASSRGWRENYSPYAIDLPFYLVKMFYMLCIRGKIYSRNVINSIATKTAHKLYTTGRLKSHSLPSDFLLRVPKKSKCG